MSIKRTPLVLLVGLVWLAAGCNKPGPDKQEDAAVKAKVEAAVCPPPSSPDGGKKQDLVALGSNAQKMVGLALADVQMQSLPTTLTTTGEVVANADREAHVTTRVPGRVVRVAKTVGDWVQPGETIAVLESVELGQAQAEFLQAQAKYELARSMVERQRTLFTGNLTAKKEVQATENALRLAQIDLEKSTNELKLLGVTPARIASLQRSRQLDPMIPLLAPIHGVVIAKHLTLGEMLKPDTSDPAFTLSDTSQLWVNADVYEKDLARVAKGQTAIITTNAYPGKVYRGQVSLVSAMLEKDSRTAKAKIVVSNADGKLKPEMFASVRIDVGSQRVLAVPKAAVQEEDKRKLVFVPAGDDKFKEVPIQIGTEYPEFYQVTAGLSAGDKVVTKGSFDLHAQARKASFGGED